jgi:hypothetical protein
LKAGDRIAEVATRQGIVQELLVERPPAEAPSALDREKARAVLSDMLGPGEWPQLLERLAECITPKTDTGRRGDAYGAG